MVIAKEKSNNMARNASNTLQYAKHGSKQKKPKRKKKTKKEAIYASETLDFLRWKILRVRDLLLGFLSFSFSPLACLPRERESLASASAIYLSL
jgi:hypothetical protein